MDLWDACYNVLLSFANFHLFFISSNGKNTLEIQYNRLELSKSKFLYLSSETSPKASQYVKMTTTMGHFDF